MPTTTQNLRAVDPRSSPTPQLLSASSRYDSGSLRQPPTFDARGGVSQGSADVTQLTTAFVRDSMQCPEVQLADYLIPKGMGPAHRTEGLRESSYAVAPYRDPLSPRYTPEGMDSRPPQVGIPNPVTTPTSHLGVCAGSGGTQVAVSQGRRRWWSAYSIVPHLANAEELSPQLSHKAWQITVQSFLASHWKSSSWKVWNSA